MYVEEAEKAEAEEWRVAAVSCRELPENGIQLRFVSLFSVGLRIVSSISILSRFFYPIMLFCKLRFYPVFASSIFQVRLGGKTVSRTIHRSYRKRGPPGAAVGTRGPPGGRGRHEGTSQIRGDSAMNPI